MTENLMQYVSIYFLTDDSITAALLEWNLFKVATF